MMRAISPSSISHMIVTGAIVLLTSTNFAAPRAVRALKLSMVAVATGTNAPDALHLHLDKVALPLASPGKAETQTWLSAASSFVSNLRQGGDPRNMVDDDEGKLWRSIADIFAWDSQKFQGVKTKADTYMQLKQAEADRMGIPVDELLRLRAERLTDGAKAKDNAGSEAERAVVVGSQAEAIKAAPSAGDVAAPSKIESGDTDSVMQDAPVQTKNTAALKRARASNMAVRSERALDERGPLVHDSHVPVKIQVESEVDTVIDNAARQRIQDNGGVPLQAQGIPVQEAVAISAAPTITEQRTDAARNGENAGKIDIRLLLPKIKNSVDSASESGKQQDTRNWSWQGRLYSLNEAVVKAAIITDIARRSKELSPGSKVVYKKKGGLDINNKRVIHIFSATVITTDYYRGDALFYEIRKDDGEELWTDGRSLQEQEGSEWVEDAQAAYEHDHKDSTRNVINDILWMLIGCNDVEREGPCIEASPSQLGEKEYLSFIDHVIYYLSDIIYEEHTLTYATVMMIDADLLKSVASIISTALNGERLFLIRASVSDYGEAPQSSKARRFLSDFVIRRSSSSSSPPNKGDMKKAVRRRRSHSFQPRKLRKTHTHDVEGRDCQRRSALDQDPTWGLMYDLLKDPFFIASYARDNLHGVSIQNYMKVIEGVQSNIMKQHSVGELHSDELKKKIKSTIDCACKGEIHLMKSKSSSGRLLLEVEKNYEKRLTRLRDIVSQLTYPLSVEQK